jgi:GATA-binding protein
MRVDSRKEGEEFKATQGPANEEEAPLRDQALGRLREAPQVEHKLDNVGEPDERGRRIDRGKARVRVEEEEYVPSLSV